MQQFISTFVLRHRKENLKKCSLRGLEIREDFRFETYPLAPSIAEFPDLSHYILLDINAPPLGEEDNALGLFIIDATWRYAGLMAKQMEPLTKSMTKRSIPACYRTAYPRRQTDCPFPECGLASIEAIYVAYYILKRDVSGLLDHYYWKESFLKINSLSVG